MENSICTVSIYLPEAVGGHYTDGHYSATPRVEKVVKGSTITVPSPNVSYLPNGVYFGGWHVGTPDAVKTELGLETMTFWKQGNETVIEPGTPYTVNGDMNVTARYVGIMFVLHDAENNSDMLFTFDNMIAQRITLSGRTLYKNGDWNTLCLPFNLTQDESPLAGGGVEAKTLGSTSFDNGTLMLNFNPAPATIPAGTPFIIRWTSGDNIVDPVFESVTVHNELTEATSERVDFVGTFSPVRIYEPDEKTKLYLGANNQIGYATTEGFRVNSNRAYFLLKNVLTADDPQSAGVRAFKVNFGDETTGITELEQHSHLSPWYTLDGRHVNGRPALKGLYIYKGKKVVVK